MWADPDSSGSKLFKCQALVSPSNLQPTAVTLQSQLIVSVTMRRSGLICMSVVLTVVVRLL